MAQAAEPAADTRPSREPRDLAAADRDAALGEVADEPRALVGGDVEEALEVRHRARREVVEHEQRVLGRTALLDRDGQPALRILPVAGHRVPGHDRVAALHEVVHRDGVQQPLVEVPAAAEGAEQPVGVGEVAQQLLGEVDLAADAVRVVHAPEGHGVRVRVVGDPVALARALAP